MKLETITTDIKKLEQALKIIQGTENYMHFQKTNIMMDICEQINVLKDKRDNQIRFLQGLQTN